MIPSGIRCTHAATIERCFLEVASIGVITTKSIGAQPRKGYREPIYARYAPGCYINAVGLANPGAEAYLAEFEGIEMPGDKFLLVSIIGSDVDSFVAAALTLEPIADGFELNMSCPHAKGYGAEVGQDTELLGKITEAVVRAAGVPVFVKLSSTLPNLGATAAAAVAAGAAGLTLINTVGPALAAVGTDPILHNRLGGLSGDGIRPMGLRAVEQVRKAVGTEPIIIGMGGIASPEHVRQYAAAGADLFGIGSALTGLDGGQMRDYMAQLHEDVCHGSARAYARSCESAVRMDYVKTRVTSRVDYGDGLFKLVLEELPEGQSDGDLAGKFYFLCLPGVGEKPFAIFSTSEKSVVVRTVGEFTRTWSKWARRGDSAARAVWQGSARVEGPHDRLCGRRNRDRFAARNRPQAAPEQPGDLPAGRANRRAPFRSRQVPLAGPGFAGHRRRNRRPPRLRSGPAGGSARRAAGARAGARRVHQLRPGADGPALLRDSAGAGAGGPHPRIDRVHDQLRRRHLRQVLEPLGRAHLHRRPVPAVAGVSAQGGRKTAPGPVGTAHIRDLCGGGARTEYSRTTTESPLFTVHLAYRTDTLNQAYQTGLMTLAETTGGASYFCRSQAEISETIGRVFETIRSHSA